MRKHLSKALALTLAMSSLASVSLAEGSVLAQGAPEELLNNTDVRRVYLGDSFTL